jgi:PAS domain S-box-containing protein
MSSKQETTGHAEVSPTCAADATDPVGFAEALGRAKASMSSANLSLTEGRINLLWDLAANRIDRAAACCLQIELHLRRSEVPESIIVALACLKEFEIVIPERPDQLELETHAIGVWARLDGRPVEDLVNLPPMQDNEMKAVMSVLAAMSNSAYLTDERLLGVTLCHMLTITLQYGLTEQAVLTFVLFGFFIGHHFGRYKDGMIFCELALTVVQRYGFWEYEPKAITFLELVAIWTRPLDDVIELTRSCIAARSRSNDIPFLCYAYVRIVTHRIARGDDLEQISAEIDTSTDLVVKADFVANLLPLTAQRRFVEAMRHGRVADDVFDDGLFSARDFESSFVPAQTPTYICYYWILKAQAFFMYGEFEKARHAMEQAAGLTWASTGHIQLVDFHFISALASAAMCEDGPDESYATIVGNVDWLARWAATCPETFLGKQLLGLAEVARIDGQFKKAERLYEQSIELASRHGLLADEALAYETAGRFYRRYGAVRSANDHFVKARDCYMRWGARGKVAQLEEAYPEYFADATAVKLGVGAPDASGSLVAAILELSQTFSATIDTGHLSETIIKSFLHISGAEEAILLELRDGEIWVDAKGKATTYGAAIDLDPTLAQESDVSSPHVMEAARTLEIVWAGNAQPGPESAATALYIPLVKKSRLAGVLFLRLAVGSSGFDPEAVAVLQAVAPQVAIALENSRSFAELRHEKAVLAESEQEFRMSNDTMPSMIWSADANGGDEWFNKEWYEYTGLTPNEARNGGWKYVFHPDDRAESAATWYRIVTTREMSGLEARLRRHDGEYRWFIVRAKPLCDSTGRIVRCYGSESDIDDLKRAEILLAGEKRSFEMIASGEPLGTILDSLCQTLTVLSDGAFVSIMLLDEHGRTLRPAGGYRLPEGFNEEVGGIPVGPQAGSCGTAAFRREPVLVEDVETDPLWVEVRQIAQRFNIRTCWSTPIMSARGAVFGTIAVYSDRRRTMGDRERQAIDRFTQLASFVIERKNSEEALMKSEALLAEGQRISHTGSWAWNIQSDKLQWSEEHGNIFGYRIADVGGTLRDMLERMLPEERAFLESSMRAAAALKQDLQFEFQATLPNGAVKQLLYTGRIVLGEAGEVKEYVGTTMDITERKRVEFELQKSAVHLREVQAELEHVARATSMGELAASIAHEVNQPLAGIVASGGAALRWLSRPVPDVGRAVASLKNVVDDGRRASDIVTRIRKMFRKETMAVEPTDLKELIADVTILTRGELQKTKVSLKLDIPEGLPTVPVDRVQLQQVFVNLILNAIEAMREASDSDRRLTIDVKQDDELIVVGVSDNGPGIPDDRVENIFRPFESSKANGMGMGLSICRTIVEHHGGQMRLAQTRATGCRFEFTLPVEASRA